MIQLQEYLIFLGTGFGMIRRQRCGETGKLHIEIVSRDSIGDPMAILWQPMIIGCHSIAIGSPIESSYIAYYITTVMDVFGLLTRWLIFG
jgi:hypothetical protein